MSINTSSCTDTILMIRPFRFRLNEQSAVNNYYMTAITDKTAEEIDILAKKEFDQFTNKLEAKGINVLVVEDEEFPDTPDAIFPNNWVSFHQNGKAAIYPMYAPNRRQERRTDIFDIIGKSYKMEEVIDFTAHEDLGRYMEGTGSMTLDRKHKIAYAALSGRTDKGVLEEFCSKFDYQPVSFVANQTVNNQRLPIYHTNVLMCVGDSFAIICLEAIDDPKERQMIVQKLKLTGKQIIEITEHQKHCFAGNMLQLKSSQGVKHVVMSTAAFSSLEGDQISAIEQYGEIIHSPLETIETLGGGSARCMMAEVFLPAL